MSYLAARGQFVTYTTIDGDDVRVEIEPSDDGFMPVSGERPLGSMEYLFRPVFSAADSLIREARSAHPDEVTVRFGIKVTGSGKAVIARKVDEGNFEISLNWNRSATSPDYNLSP
jgi:hypothetical protein